MAFNDQNFYSNDIQPPCKDCANREVGCHGKCRAYLLYKEIYNATKEQIVLEKGREKLFYDYIMEQSCKIKREKRRMV